MPVLLHFGCNPQGNRATGSCNLPEADELPPIKRFEVNYVPVMPDKDENKWKFDITVDEDGVYVVEADWLVKVLGMVNIEDEESLGYFQRVLRQSGIIDRLEEMGINEGDTVSILNFEFDYIR